MTDDERKARDERLREAGRELARRLATPEGKAAMKEAAERTRKRQEELRRMFEADRDRIRELLYKPRRWWTGR